MLIEDNLTLLHSLLNNGDTILIPSDGIWGLSCDARNTEAINRIVGAILPHEEVVEEIIFSDLVMMKKYTESLHPRIETLLVYHDRPLRISCGQKLIDDRKIYMRLTKDTVSRILLRELDFPLYFMSFMGNNDHQHLDCAQIDLQRHSRVNFIAKETVEVNEDQQYGPLLKIEFDQDGLITVLH